LPQYSSDKNTVNNMKLFLAYLMIANVGSAIGSDSNTKVNDSYREFEKSKNHYGDRNNIDPHRGTWFSGDKDKFDIGRGFRYRDKDKSEGEACIWNKDCESDNCDWATRKCQGEICAMNADCDEDKYCCLGRTNTCQDLKKIGEYCDWMGAGDDCESGHCDTSKWIKNVCAYPKSDGEKCLYDGDCASGVCEESHDEKKHFKWTLVKKCSSSLTYEPTTAPLVSPVSSPAASPLSPRYPAASPLSPRYAAATRVAGRRHRYPPASPLSPRYAAAARVAGHDKFKVVQDKMKDVRDKFKDEERFLSPAASPASHRYLDASQDMAGFDRKDFRFKLAQN